MRDRNSAGYLRGGLPSYIPQSQSPVNSLRINALGPMPHSLARADVRQPFAQKALLLSAQNALRRLFWPPPNQASHSLDDRAQKQAVCNIHKIKLLRTTQVALTVTLISSANRLAVRPEKSYLRTCNSSAFQLPSQIPAIFCNPARAFRTTWRSRGVMRNAAR